MTEGRVFRLLSIIIWVDLATAYKIGCRAIFRDTLFLLVYVAVYIRTSRSRVTWRNKGTLMALGKAEPVSLAP